MDTLPEGLLLVDKPSGISSFDVIRRLRRELGVRKMGHAGTLDPLASGLMIIGVGAGTKKLAEYIGLPKSYDAEIRIGESRTTGDITGDVREQKTPHEIAHEEAREALRSMVGTLRLPVPRYSAVKQDGQRLYKKARSGQKFETPVRDMVVYGACLHDLVCDGGTCVAKVSFAVASGVYIRSLAEELGRRLGYPATVAALRRTQIGTFTLAGAREVRI